MNVKLVKLAGGDGTLVAQGPADQLRRVLAAVRALVESDDAGVDPPHAGLPDATPAAAADDEYLMPLPPADVRAVDASHMLSVISRLSNVRIHTERSTDGWATLRIVGAQAAIGEAKARIDGVLCPPARAREHEALLREEGRREEERREEERREERRQRRERPPSSSAADGAKAAAQRGGRPSPPLGVRRGGREAELRERAEPRPEPEARAAGRERGAPPAGPSGAEAVSAELIIGRHLVGRVIGKQGATIQELRSRTATAIAVTKDDAGVGHVTITGTPDAVREAKALVEGLVVEEPPLEAGSVEGAAREALPGAPFSGILQLVVPASAVGKIIGTRGGVIQAIRAETGVTIELRKAIMANGPAEVTLRGSVEAMQRAKGQIEQIVADVEAAKAIEAAALAATAALD